MKQRQLLAIVVSALVLISMALAGCGGSKPAAPPAETKPQQPAAPQPPKEKVLRISIAAEHLTFDPHNYKAGPDVVAQALIIETLVGRDKDGNRVPKLATSWKMLDPKKWEFKLREGVKFTDGTPFDGKAVKVSLERSSKAPRGSGFVGFVESVDVVDPLTVVLNLKTPFGPILDNLSDPVAGIVSPAALEKYGDDISKNPVGTGPFKLLEWIPGDRTVFVANTEYWGKKPALDKVIMRAIPEESTRLMALKSGETDLIENPAPHEVPNLKKDPNFTVIQTPRARNVWLGMNIKDKILSNKKVRQAIALAVDEETIVSSVLEGMGRVADNGFIPPEVVKLSPAPSYEYNPTKAKQLLAEAGYPNGLTLNLWTPENRYLRDKQVCEVIAQQLQQVGINCKITVMEWGSYLAACGRHEQQLYLMGWGFMTGEPAQALRQTLSTGNTFNYTQYSDPEFDELLAKAEQEADKVKRASYYQRMAEMIQTRDFAVVPLYYMYNSYASTSKVKGVYLTPNELIDLSEATIE
ncbi:MAG: ABC transporter substrate-binding protein [Firmicutes bacterium]|jgi:peptide/nickel transport system substrate-binding protein|nr:ABC transporter substrate-binding protein [Bacillota bacterium]